jgi:dolichol-phosphate mannosyltransferase
VAQLLTVFSNGNHHPAERQDGRQVVHFSLHIFVRRIQLPVQCKLRTCTAALLQRPLDDAQNLSIPGRPKEGIDGAKTESLDRSLLLTLLGDHHHGRGDILRIQRGKQILATQAGQVQVRNDQVRGRLKGLFDRPGGLIHDDRLIAQWPESLSDDQIADIGIALDNQDSFGGGGHFHVPVIAGGTGLKLQSYSIAKGRVDLDASVTIAPSMPRRTDLKGYNIAAVVPAYRVEAQIQAVLKGIPSYVRHIIVVDDASPDRSHELVSAAAKRDRRIILLRHDRNQGVGGSVITGFRRALALDAQIVLKIDGDGQMDLNYLEALILPLVQGKADYTKGNRFRDFAALRHMPLVRRVGNMGLGFLAKAATGYWNLFDPTNGFVAIRADTLAQLPLDQIDHTYYFEISMLANLYLLGAVVQDVPMPARYRNEVSSLMVERVLLEFPLKLLGTFLHRAIFKNFLYDFSMASIYLLCGVPLLLFGLVFGGLEWVRYYRLQIPAPTGTVILPTLSVLVGIQLLLSATDHDLRSIPKQPISGPL